jgi:flagellar basal-body rod protein FlgC
MKIDRLFSALNISARGLSAQRQRMNAIASNIANVETTRSEDGNPYRRKIITMKSAFMEGFGQLLQTPSMELDATHRRHIIEHGAEFTADLPLAGSIETAEHADETPFKLVHDPTHPDADENGYVRMPNVNIVTEMVDMMSASRAYEANVTVINAEKNIAKDSLEI